VPNNPDKMSRLVLLPPRARRGEDRPADQVGQEDRMPMDENRIS
jgi:hypothetical protein